MRARRAPRRRTSSSSGKTETSSPRRRPQGLRRGESNEECPIAGKEDKIEFEGEVIEAFRNGMYKILLDNGHETLGYTAGKMRRYRIKILPGDRVNVELSPYDLSRGRIVYRHR